MQNKHNKYSNKPQEFRQNGFVVSKQLMTSKNNKLFTPTTVAIILLALLGLVRLAIECGLIPL